MHIKIPSSVHEWRVSAVMQRCKISFLPLICSRRSLLMCLSSFHIFRHRCRGQTKVMTRIKYLPVSKKENASLFFAERASCLIFYLFPANHPARVFISPFPLSNICLAHYTVETVFHKIQFINKITDTQKTITI